METYFNKQKDELYNKAIELVENATQVRVESEDKDIEIEVTDDFKRDFFSQQEPFWLGRVFPYC